MIVRNEAGVVAEALDSVVEHIDTWVIVDTGSRDGTPQVVEEYFRVAGIAGQLVERPWVDFGTNRTEALEMCRGRADYTWVHDADDLLVGTPELDGLTADAYLLRIRFDGGELESWRPQLFRTDLQWHYEGAVHEMAVCADATEVVRLPGDYHVEARSVGARSRSANRFHVDRQLLERSLDAHPDDLRAIFYLAQSCQDSGDLSAAERYYAQRATMGGWDEEVFLALLRRARMLDLLGHPWPDVQAAYLAAWEVLPSRAEPLMDVARRLRSLGDHHQALLFAEQAAQLPLPGPEALLVAPADYGWRVANEIAVCSFHVGRLDRAEAAARSALDDPTLPAADRIRIEANLAQMVGAAGVLAGSSQESESAHASGAGTGAATRRFQVEVLNLARRPDRLRAFRLAAVRAYGEAETERIERREAIDGRHLVASPALLDVFRWNGFGDRRAVIAHALSHLAAWGTAAERSIDTLILEDDVRLRPDLLVELDWCMDEADDVVPDADLLLLGYHRMPHAPLESTLPASRMVTEMRWDRYHSGTFGYVVSPAGGARLIELVYEHGIADALSGFLVRHREEISVAEVRPALVTAPLATASGDEDSDVAYDLTPIRPG